MNSDKLDSKNIYLNNKVLSVNDDGSISEIEKKLTNGTVTVEPYSIV